MRQQNVIVFSSIHVLLPSMEAVERYPKLLSETRAFLGEHLYGQHGTFADCKIMDPARTIGFCCKPVNGRLHVIDMPTTLLASQKTAQKILDIKADDAIEKDHLSRLLAKEIDLFRNTLAQFLVKSKDVGYHVIATDATAGANTIYIDLVENNQF